ncbi:hypothetical protein H4R33_003263 [Dimargaris cristalligena]|nr:hypothetical protein H4R33_003263 [Dimargaris cristalligena]
MGRHQPFLTTLRSSALTIPARSTSGIQIPFLITPTLTPYIDGMTRTKLPFFKTAEHRLPVLALYRNLLRLAGRFRDDIEQRYLKCWLRERFRFFMHLVSPLQTQQRLQDALEIQGRLSRALQGDTGEQKFVNDLAYGQFGRIYDIIYRRKRCRYLDDIRSSAAIKRDPHPAYRITLDPRVYSPPERLTRIDILDFDPPYVPDTLRVIDSVTANGFYFKRIKDIKTPRRLTVRINRFNVQNQHHITAIQLYSEFVDHARMEDQWLQSLDLPTGYDSA